MGTKAAVAPGTAPATGYGEEKRSPAPSPIRAGRAAWQQEEPGCCKSLGGTETKRKTHRGSTNPLGLWTLAPEKLRCQVMPGEGNWTMSHLDSNSLLTGWKVGLCKKPCPVTMTSSYFVRNSQQQLTCAEGDFSSVHPDTEELSRTVYPACLGLCTRDWTLWPPRDGWFQTGSSRTTWASGGLEIVTQTWSPSSQNHRKGEKRSSLPSFCGI